jgi:hypothetical protein
LPPEGWEQAGEDSMILDWRENLQNKDTITHLTNVEIYYFRGIDIKPGIRGKREIENELFFS